MDDFGFFSGVTNTIDNAVQQGTGTTVAVMFIFFFVFAIVLLVVFRPIIRASADRKKLENEQLQSLQGHLDAQYARNSHLEAELDAKNDEISKKDLKIAEQQAQIQQMVKTFNAAYSGLGDMAFVRDNITGVYDFIETIENFISKAKICIPEEKNP